MKFDHIQQFFFFGLLLIVSGMFLWMLGGYLIPVFWATVIAIVFYPLFKRFERALKGRASLASLLTMLVFVLIVLVPLGVVGTMVVQESLDLYQRVNQDGNPVNTLSLIDRSEALLVHLEPYGVSRVEALGKLREWAGTVSQALTSALVSFSQSTLSLLVYTAVTLYLLFFFLRDGKKIQETLVHYLPLGDVYEKRLFARFSETTRAVIKGTLVIAVLQGFIGGVIFSIAGISNPVLWGVSMAIVAIIPAVGPGLIWVPVSIVLLATGSVWEGVMIIIAGVFVIGLLDNILRPILVGRGLKMPDALVLLSTLGGLAAFGVAGFVAGPIIAAFFLSLWLMFGEHYKQELAENK